MYEVQKWALRLSMVVGWYGGKNSIGGGLRALIGDTSWWYQPGRVEVWCYKMAPFCRAEPTATGGASGLQPIVECSIR